MVLGPVMMVRPTKRDSRLAKLRGIAAAQGLQVRMVRQGDGEVAAYALPWPEMKARKFAGPVVQLRRRHYSHGLHLADTWEVQPAQLTEDLKAALTQFVNPLPDTVVGASLGEGGLALHWREIEGEAVLAQVEEALRRGVVVLQPMVTRVRREPAAASDADELL